MQQCICNPFVLVCARIHKTDHKTHLLWCVREALTVSGQRANMDFVRSAPSLRSFLYQGHLSAVEENREEGGNDDCIFHPETEQLKYSQYAEKSVDGEHDGARMKGSHRCIFSDLEQEVQACITMHPHMPASVATYL